MKALLIMISAAVIFSYTSCSSAKEAREKDNVPTYWERRGNDDWHDGD